MAGLIKNEMIKTLADKKFYAFLAVIFLIQILPVVGSWMVNVASFDGQTYPLFIYRIIAGWVTPIFLIIWLADAITEEYSTGTLTLSLVHPVSRTKLLLVKIVAALILTNLLFAYAILGGYLIGSIAFGWGAQFIISGISYPAGIGILLTVGAYAAAIIPLIAFSMTLVLLSLLFSRSSVMVGGTIALLLVLTVLGQLLSELQPYLITSLFSSFSELLLLEHDINQSMRTLGILALYGLVPLLISFRIFQRRDLLY